MHLLSFTPIVASLLLLTGSVVASPEAEAMPQSSSCKPNVGYENCQNPTAPYSYLPQPCLYSTGGCYPTNYYAAFDQGQFKAYPNGFDGPVSNRCETLCNANPRCQSWVATLNITPAKDLATATCFLYPVKALFPRQCADQASRLLTAYKFGTCPK